jgi:ABC-2 type transport system ATP-binding protein
MYSIELKNLYARVDSFELKDINLNIPKGSVIGLLGKNGAGKTTLFHTLLGTHLKYDGDMIINGMRYETDEKNIRTSIAIVHDAININPLAKGNKLYKIYQMIYPNFDGTYFLNLCEEFSIHLDKRINKMSLGMQKKLTMAIALSLKPSILLLDEPFIGIDPIDKQKMMKHVQAFMEDENKTVIISSHYVEDVEKISDYVAIINDGEIKIFDEKDKILDQYVIVNLSAGHKYISKISYPKKTSFGIQGLILKSDADKYNIDCRRPTLEELFIMTNEGGETNELF